MVVERRMVDGGGRGCKFFFEFPRDVSQECSSGKEIGSLGLNLKDLPTNRSKLD